MPASIFFATTLMAAGAIVLSAGPVCGQVYPSKPIRIITAPPGGGANMVSRLIAQAITVGLGQQVIVDNRSNIIGSEMVAKAPPDGYTLTLTGSLWIVPVFEPDVLWDPMKDFAPIALTNRSPNVLVVHPSLPVKLVRELIALAKARPGMLNYGSGPTSAATSVAGALFKVMADVNIVPISYKGSGLAVTDLIGGQLHLTFAPLGSVMGFVQAGRLRGLAVTTSEPSALAPGLPTVAASGLPGYESAITYGMFAPGKTPATIVNRLNHEIVQSLNKADFKDKFFDAGLEIVASSPEECVAWMKSEMTRLRKVATR